MAPEVRTSKSSFLMQIYAFFGESEEKPDVEAVCIFKVHPSLSSTKPEAYIPQEEVLEPYHSTKPEAYIPQEVGLGPYHHWRSELQGKQMYKLARAKRILKGFNTVGFEKLVELLKGIVVPSARALYNTYLDMKDEDLACIMAIDGLFLFDLLCSYGKCSPSDPALFHDLMRSRQGEDSTVRDVMTLENQIPMLVMKVILIVEYPVPGVIKVMRTFFPRMLLGFCTTISPLSVLQNNSGLKMLRYHHLLDLLYHLIILKDLSGIDSNEEKAQEEFINATHEKVKKEIKLKQDDIAMLMDVYSAASTSSGRPESASSGTIIAKASQVVEGFSGLPFQMVISSIQDLATREPQEDVLVPRASKLCKAGVVFCNDHHVTNINFNSEKKSFHLPVISINVNSEIIIRNLVVYETMIKFESKSHLLTRYLELMSGLIQTSEDVKVLTDHGIIKKSGSIDDEEIAKMFNKMGKPVNLTNPLEGIYDEQDPLEKAIKDIKSYYDDSWKVSAGKFIKKWGRIAWKLIKFLAVLVIFLLFAAQSVCTVYDCSASNHLKYTSRLQGISPGRKLNWI